MDVLAALHDPRDQGRCDRCGGPRLDDTFVCRDCGRPNGLFGQMLVGRLAGGDGLGEQLHDRPAPGVVAE